MKYLDPLLLTVPDRVRQFCNPTNPIQITQALDKRIQAKPKLRLLAPLLAFFFLLCGSNLAYADEIIYSDEIGTRRTNWNDSLQIPQFDPNLGILSSIEIRLSANVVGSAAFENTGPSSAPVTMTHSALVTIILPTGTSVTSVPTNRLVTTVPRFDNEFDYAGESGDTVQLSATDVDEVVLTEAAEMAPFIGTGIINFPAEALGSSSSQGPGNFALLLSANSSGVVLTIHYIFAVTDIDIETYTNGFDADDANDPTVPEIAVGDPVTWTYDVQNTGEVTFTLDEVVVTDSVTGVVPEFIPSSDDGDGLLAPGEVWQYRFVTTAIDLTDAPDGTPIVDGCDAGNTFRTRPTYENVGTVTVDRYSLIDTDPTHHCTPFDQSLTVRKLINGIDVQANRSNNVPQLEPGDPITWTYEVLNDGNATFALNELSVTDSDPAVTPVFDPTSDSGGDQLLSPGETWLYTATGTAQNLDRPNPGTSIVSGCGPEESDAQRSAYQNVATVVAGDIVQVDESFYCQDRSTELTIEKLTNGFDADLPNDSDVPQLTPGDSVTWTYQVQNIGSGQVTLSDIQVTDSQTGIIPRFDPESDVGSDGILSPDETWLFMATSLVQYLHLPDPTVDTVPGCDPDGEGRLRNAYVNIGTVTLGSQSDTDSSHYCIAPNPQIQVEKLTNGIDADDPNEVGVPLVAPGAEVIWTYLVKNVGNVPLPQADIRVTDSQTDILPVLDDSSDSNADQILSPGETWRYQASATAVDLTVPPANIQTISGCDPANLNLTRLAYMNTATVTVGTINDTDSSHYCNPPLSDLVIEKRTNTVDADQPNDRFIPIVAPGEPITWTYTVRNRGAITYTAGQVSVTDSDPAVEPTWMPDSDRNDDQLLSPGEIWRYIAIGVAQDLTAPDPGTIVVDGCDPDNTGAKRATYQNIAIVQAGSSSDSDASHYCQPPVRSLDILKLTNGIDVADANAPSVPRLAPGDPIQWTYLITNTGLVEIPLDEITVTDSDLNVTPLFDATSDVNNDAILSPGESWRYHASGQALELSSPNPGTTVVQGCSSNGTVEPRPTYQNAATVEAGETADSDVSYYCNVIPGIALIKLTNQADAANPNGPDVPVLQPGAIVTWTYLVTNTGEIPFDSLEVEIVDSDPNVVPELDTASDDGNDGILSPNEVWRYLAVSTVLNLNDTTDNSITLVRGCTTSNDGESESKPTYENVAAVQATPHLALGLPPTVAVDKSHYCNPSTTDFEVQKLTNGVDADDANGIDLPVVAPGDIASENIVSPVRWTYILTNTGTLDIMREEINIAESDTTLTITFLPSSDLGRDDILSPGEIWTYTAEAPALNLSLSQSINDPRVVEGCTGISTPTEYAYRNTVTVSIGNLTRTDPSHYCNSVPDALDSTSEPMQVIQMEIYLPMMTVNAE